MCRGFGLAEKEGFEPPGPAKGQRFSRPPHSTTLPFLRCKNTFFLFRSAMLFHPAPSIFPEKSIPCQALDPKPSFVIIFVFVPETVPMKKLLTLSLLLLFPLALSLAGNLRANLSFCTFWSPQDGPYIETYLSVEGQSLQWQKVADGFQATVEVTMIFKQGDKVANFGKYALHSPIVQDT